MKRFDIVHMSQSYFASSIIITAHTYKAHSPGARKIFINTVGAIIYSGQFHYGTTSGKLRLDGEDQIIDFILRRGFLAGIMSLFHMLLHIGNSVSSKLTSFV